MTVEELARLLDPDGQPHKAGAGRLSVRCVAHKDNHPSLTVWIDDKGKAAFNCHAGCTHEQIVAALPAHAKGPIESTWGTSNVRILIPTRRHKPAAPETPAGNLEAEYPYKDHNGAVQYVVRRFPGKRIRMYHPGPSGGLISGRGDSDLYPYRLPDVIAAREAGDLIYIVEGEKDADTLANHGLTASCNVGGAGKWTTDYTPWFKGTNVVILPDNDPPGAEHARQVHTQLSGVAANVRIVNLPDLPDKGDVTDWLQTHTVEELEQFAHQTVEEPSIFGQIYTRSELAAIPPPKTIFGPYIVDGGVNMLYGRWGTAKSFLVLSWAAHLATGTAWNGHDIDRPQGVFYWAAEGQGGLDMRLTAWETHYGLQIPDDRLRVPQKSPSLDREATFDALAQMVETCEVDHLMIDTLIRVKGTLRENEADELGGYLLTELAHRIAATYNCSVTLVHHIGHEAKDRPRGSSSITDNLDGLYEIRDAGGDLKSLHVRKLKDQPMDEAPDMFELRQVGPSAVLVPTSRLHLPSDQQDVLTTLRAMGADGRWISKKQLAAACGVSEGTLRTRIKDLIAQGIVDYEEGRGSASRYRIIPDNPPSQTVLEGAQNGVAHPPSDLPDPY